jgi:hypothetical protein
MRDSLCLFFDLDRRDEQRGVRHDYPEEFEITGAPGCEGGRYLLSPGR